jgi:uncharacterized membrane protein
MNGMARQDAELQAASENAGRALGNLAIMLTKGGLLFRYGCCTSIFLLCVGISFSIEAQNAKSNTTLSNVPFYFITLILSFIVFILSLAGCTTYLSPRQRIVTLLASAGLSILIFFFVIILYFRGFAENPGAYYSLYFVPGAFQFCVVGEIIYVIVHKYKNEEELAKFFEKALEGAKS